MQQLKAISNDKRFVYAVRTIPCIISTFLIINMIFFPNRFLAEIYKNYFPYQSLLTLVPFALIFGLTLNYKKKTVPSPKWANAVNTFFAVALLISAIVYFIKF